MNATNRDDKKQLLLLFNKILDQWYLFALSIIVFIAIAILIIKTSPPIFEVFSILKLNAGSTKTERILNTSDLEKPEINLEDKIIEIKTTNFIDETINQLDFTISYFTKDKLSTFERYKSDFPVSVKVDSSSNLLTDLLIKINILSNEQYELEYFTDNEILNLYNYSTDISLNQQTPKTKFKKTFYFDKPTNEPNLNLIVSLTGDPNRYNDDHLFFKINNPNSLIETYLNNLKLEIPSRNSSILLLKLNSENVKRESAFLNALMNVIIRKNLEEKNQEALKTIDFIDFQIADVSTSLNQVESDLEGLGYANTSIGESSVLYQRRNQLESQIASYKVQTSNLRSLLNNLESLKGSAGSIDIDDPMIDNLLIKLSDLIQQRAQLKRTATEANPIIQRVNLDIETTKEALRSAVNSTINNYNAIVDDLSNRLDQTNSRINRLPGAERKKLGIQRKFEFSDNTYDLLMERKATAGIALATSTSDWSIVEYAKVNKARGQVSPNKKFYIIVAFLLGVFLPITYIFLRNYLDTKFKSREDLIDATNIQILGELPKEKNKKHRSISKSNAKSVSSEAFRDLRINLQHLLQHENNKVIGITSSMSGEGKTYIALNLATIFAQSGKKVLMVDADLRNSNITNIFNLDKNTIGLTNFLIKKTNFQDIIIKTDIKNLDLIPPGPNPPNPTDLLELPQTNLLISELRKRYDYIIFDSPPIGLVADYLILSRYFDYNLYVVRHNYTKRENLKKINELYDEKKFNNMKIVLNGVSFNEIYGSKQYYKKYFN